MITERSKQIGLDRLVRLAWLEKVSSLVLAGNDQKEIKAILQSDLAESFRSAPTDVRGSLDKTITILLKVWLKTPPELEPLRIEGLEFLKHLNRQDRIAIHWGMLMAVYPFWSSVAIQVGRLLRLQGTAASVQVQRRIREQYGERETASRRTRYILRSFLDWGVLNESGTQGIYVAGPALPIDNIPLIVWLTEAALHARPNGQAPMKDLLESPTFFPFQISPVQAEKVVVSSSRLDIIRHGLDSDLVFLKNKKMQ